VLSKHHGLAIIAFAIKTVKEKWSSTLDTIFLLGYTRSRLGLGSAFGPGPLSGIWRSGPQDLFPEEGL
jgi:hypothetical protein